MSESQDESVVESASADSTQDSHVEESAATEVSIEDVVKERDEFKDIALRVQADFENYRKRAATQMSDELDRALGKLVEQLLPVLDACEAAVAHGDLALAGKPFDPALADAVMHEEGDGSEPVVLEVLRTGYRWKGRVLRAAMVKVKG